ncbi:serine/threonine-protein kinase [Nocardia sp. NPDC003693]
MRLINNRYELRELVGRGGMAEVWGAWDRQLRRQVAVKVLDSGSLPPLERDERIQRQRFEQEAHIAAQMNCRNIVMVHDSGIFTENGRRYPFLVMEFIHGRNLRQYLRDQQNTSLPALFRILTDALEGLVYAHAKHVVHRDIKPENIMICRDGPAKLADFGIAIEMRATMRRLTHDQRALGTQPYAAPEYLHHGEITHLSDVYSFAVVCAEALEFAYGGEPLPTDLRFELDRARSLDPALRHRSAAEFQHLFRQAIDRAMRPVRNPPPELETTKRMQTTLLTPGDTGHLDPEPPAPALPTHTTWQFLTAPMIESRQRILAGLHRDDFRIIGGVLATAVTVGILTGGLAFILLTWVCVQVVNFVGG